MDNFSVTPNHGQPHLTHVEVRFTLSQSSNLVALTTPEVAP